MSLVLAQNKNRILTISLNRADKKNAITLEMYAQLASLLQTAADDDTVNVVLLKGEGGCFSAGNDISVFAQRDEGDSISEIVAFMDALLHFPKPVVAQVQGVAVGIGTTLLLHCDMVYCDPNTQFCLPFINLGLVPEYASSYILPRIAGRRKACEWLMLGEMFGAQEAHQFGVVTAIESPEKLAEKVSSVCNKLASKPVFAMTHTKKLLTTEQDAIQQQINEELDVFLEALNTEAAKEAFDAFINKRPLNTEKFK
ncbi:enoyl-CoA hydratase-related protein [Alteromonas sp. C1M14]|uniref:enoyl-CoA hydratase-related protein n=1 Tax=Alteromonas sp. C1M14 TaxID=2841567 RepID=UPI001C0A1324|nr:enoyl-CoA hydratase-related protein [Alteromonas sp. C1M14]MBU2976765.1 enoyl-CoA hydratase/isomerase family protein [Alteromonas sp. C1M14]